LLEKIKAIFLDRDGVIIKDNDLVISLSQVEVYPLVGDAIALLRNLGYKIFLISNQTVIARGLLSFDQTVELNNDILKLVAKQNEQALFDDVFLCPHHPKASLPEYRLDCECRKPKAGMILTAQKKYGIALADSIVIGDRPTDIYSGKSVGCLGIQLQNGQESAPLIESNLTLKSEWLIPDYTFKTLYEAALFIKDRQ
jgi:D,D-heptose 1,7-bisphosphate phosphatase